MQIQINTDKNIDGNERLISFYSTELKNELERFDSKITRVKVHFGDENSTKSGLNDKRCLIEVRIANKQPFAVTHYSESQEKAFFEALEKVKKSLDATFDKMRTH
jgi:hypothetical protein